MATDKTTEIGRDRLWTHARWIMLICRFEGEIIGVNPAWTDILGWSQDEAIGMSFWDLVHPDDIPHTQAAAAQMMEGAQLPKFENRYLCSSGEYRDIDWTATHDGEQIHALGRDVTAEKKAAALTARRSDCGHQGQPGVDQFEDGPRVDASVKGWWARQGLNL